MPKSPTDARIYKISPHEGTAKAMLAEVYLAMAGYPVNEFSKYELAAQKAEEVIENANFYGYALLDDLESLWKENNDLLIVI